MVGQECANPGQRKKQSAQRNPQGGQSDQPSQGGQGDQGDQQGADIDPETEECIIRVIGYMPEEPEDLTEEQKIALSQECFGHNQQRQGPPPSEGGELDEETAQCILDTLGFMPESKDEITQEQMIMIGEACLGSHRQEGGPRGPGQGDGPDEEALQCITEVLGFLPERPEDLSHEQHVLIGQECFGGQGDGGPGDLTDEEIQCVIDVLGFLPERPEDLTDQQRMDLGRTCFADEHRGPPPDDETTQCIIDVLGFMPSGPEELSQEQMAMLGEACFANDRGPGGDHNGRGEMDEATNQCIIDILGFLPEHPEDLTYDQKSQVGRECFDMDLSNADDLGNNAVACITDLLGYLPSNPEEMTDAEKAMVSEQCFGEDFIDDVGEDVGIEDDLAECLVEVLGYMPAGPDSLSNEEKMLVARECFLEEMPQGDSRRDEQRGDPQNGGGDPRGDRGQGGNPGQDNEALVRCAVETFGYIPESVQSLTEEEKQMIAAACLR